jgi:hypothetical protein
MINILKLFVIFLVAVRYLFANDFFSNRVYLATYPRSGNHWMRYMVEELTGIATGSVYPDGDQPVHLPTIFPWGGYAPRGGYEGNRIYPASGDLCIIKTHFPVMGGFDNVHKSAIRIVRNPIDSFYSYAVYQQKVKDELFPYSLLSKYLNDFKNFQLFWDGKENTLTVKYEDLLVNQSETLKKIADFLGISYAESDIKRVVQKYPPIGEYLKHKNKFTEKMVEQIKSELAEFLEKYDYNI